MAGQTALITGFEPYGGRGVNPSAEVARRLDGREIDGARVVGSTMPVSYHELKGRIEELIAQVQPSLVLSLGLWPGEPVIRLERVAINVADFEIPDNEGAFLEDADVEGNGPTALAATVPLRAMEQALLEAGIPARRSGTAGTFLCNATLYTFLSGLAAAGREVPCGFVHLPYLPDQVADLMAQTRDARALELHQRADLASMDLGTMIRALEICLHTCLASRSAAGPRA